MTGQRLNMTAWMPIVTVRMYLWHHERSSTPSIDDLMDYLQAKGDLDLRPNRDTLSPVRSFDHAHFKSDQRK